MGAYQKDKFQALLRTAMGAKSQVKFASEAGIAFSSLNQMLSTNYSRIPQRKTLIGIAQASEGRVSESQILSACGYQEEEKRSVKKQTINSVEQQLKIAKDFQDAVEKLSGSATNYPSLQNMLETAALLTDEKHIRFFIGEPAEYKTGGRMNAEQVVPVKAKWISNDLKYDCLIPFLIFCCETVKGGCIVSDSAFDMTTLMEYQNPDTLKVVFQLSEQGDLNYSDYPIVFSCTPHKPGESEKKLLKAIFGE